MLRIFAFTLFTLLSCEAVAEMLTIETRSHTVNGVTSKYVLEVNVEDVKLTPILDPAKDELPVSIEKAIELALKKYTETYESEPRGIASVSLNDFPTWDYKDRWHYKVEIIGDPHVSVVVLFNEKVILPRKK